MINEQPGVEICCANNDLKVIRYKDWVIKVSQGVIMNSHELDELHKLLKQRYFTNPQQSHDILFRIPAMIFKNNGISLQHSNGENQSHFTLSTEESILGWAMRHQHDYQEKYPWKVIEVLDAKLWKESDGVKEMNQSHQFVDLPTWDWTFLSDYCGTVNQGTATDGTLPSEGNIGYTHQLADHFKSIQHSGINMQLLQDTTTPIILFDDFNLFQDDLDDCGEVYFNVKIRVMPSCWFILFRFFLRVDNILIHMREYRYFHEFTTNSVYLDVQWKEASLNAENTSNAAVTQRLIDDKKLQRDANKLSQILPLVNDREKIHRFYEIPL